MTQFRSKKDGSHFPIGGSGGIGSDTFRNVSTQDNAARFSAKSRKGTIQLNAPVRVQSGEVTTISALAAKGKVKFTKVDNFHGKFGKTRTAYFADLTDGSGSWEIGAEAYHSRTGSTSQFMRE